MILPHQVWLAIVKARYGSFGLESMSVTPYVTSATVKKVMVDYAAEYSTSSRTTAFFFAVFLPGDEINTANANIHLQIH